MYDPKDFPALPSTTMNSSRDYPVDWLNQDSVESLIQTTNRFAAQATSHQQNLSLASQMVR